MNVPFANLVSSGGYLLLLALVSQAAGCTKSSWKAELQPATGVCRINGEPAVRAMMTLYPKGPPIDKRESNSWAIVSEEGTFSLSTYEPNDGIPVGEYDLTIIWLQNPWDGHSKDRLKGKYRSKESPLCSITIEEGENHLAPIDIRVPKLLPALDGVGPFRAR